MNQPMSFEFRLDPGDLSGIEADTVFRLGVEWKIMFDEMSGVTPFSAIVMSDNRERLGSLAVRFGRVATFRWITDDYLRMEVTGPNV